MKWSRIPGMLLVLTLTGCGSWVGEEEEIVDPPAELFDFQSSIQVDERWDRNTGKGTDEQYLILTPVVVDDRVYIADSDRRMVALNTGNGRNAWTWTLRTEGSGFFNKGDDVYITAGPGYGENTLLLGTNKGDVIALDPETGEERWRTKVTSEVLSAPQRSANTVVVRSLDGRIFALDADNGRRLWTYDRSVPPLSLRGTSRPVIDQGVIVAGFDGGHLVALDIESGRLIWESSIATPSGRSELERLVDIDASPVISGPFVYVVTFQGQLAALTLDTGRMLWNRQISSHAGMAVDEEFIYITDDHSNVWAFDRFNGGTAWRQDAMLNRGLTAPAIVGDHIVVGDFEGYVHWLNRFTGELAARTRVTRDRLISAPVVDNGVVYTYSTNGDLSALAIEQATP